MTSENRGSQQFVGGRPCNRVTIGWAARRRRAFQGLCSRRLASDRALSNRLERFSLRSIAPLNRSSKLAGASLRGVNRRDRLARVRDEVAGMALRINAMEKRASHAAVEPPAR